MSETKSNQDNQDKEEADTTSHKKEKKEIIIQETTKRMVTVDRWRGTPRASYYELIDSLHEILPAITEELHRKSFEEIKRRYKQYQGSSISDLKQIRAIFNRYKENILAIAQASFERLKEKLDLLPELLLHMENEREKWEVQNSRTDGNVRIVKRLSI